MVTLRDTLAEAVRQEREEHEQIREIARQMRDIGNAGNDEAWDRLGAALADLYLLGRRHANERIRLRLDLPIGEPATIIVWPGDPAAHPDMAHAHLLVEIEEPPAETPFGPAPSSERLS